MMGEAARMRRWILLAAPAMLASAPGLHAGGAAAALFLWMALGLPLRGKNPYPYPRKRRMGPHRLLLAYGWGVFSLCGVNEAARRIAAAFQPPAPLSDLALLAGAVFFGVICCERALRLRWPRKWSYLAGATLCALSLLLIVYRR